MSAVNADKQGYDIPVIPRNGEVITTLHYEWEEQYSNDTPTYIYLARFRLSLQKTSLEIRDTSSEED